MLHVSNNNGATELITKLLMFPNSVHLLHVGQLQCARWAKRCHTDQYHKITRPGEWHMPVLRMSLLCHIAQLLQRTLAAAGAQCTLTLCTQFL